MRCFWRFFYTVLGCWLAFPGAAQLFIAHNGHVDFFSKAPFQDIEAHSRKVGGAVKTDDRTLAFSVQLRSFEFERSLMQEHFNENYLESDRYPKATFTGKLLEETDLKKPGTYAVTAQGKLTIHGVTQERTIHGILISDKNRMTVQAEFPVKLTDHNIKIPRILFESISEVVNVKVNMLLKPIQP